MRHYTNKNILYSDVSLDKQKHIKTSKKKQLYTQYLPRSYLELNSILLTFVSVRKLCRHRCGLPAAAIDYWNPAVLCMSKPGTRQITMLKITIPKITMPKITISITMTTVLAERIMIGIIEMLADTHMSEVTPTTISLNTPSYDQHSCE